MMKRFFLVLGIVFIWSSLNAESGLKELKSDEGGAMSERQGKSGILATPLALFYADTFCGNYVAKGIGIRDSWSGNIVIDSIPGGSTVKKAFLYWMILNPTFAGNSGNFNGNPIVGDFIGSDEDPCWAVDSSYAFRKDVTSWVSGNGTYTVDFTGGTYAEGASLVVLYENTAEPEQVFLIYDGNIALIGSGEVYEWTMQGFIADSSVPEAKVTYIIADGQSDAGTPLPDSMYYKGSLLDWNCTESFDGLYWDTRTYDVSSLTPGGSTQATCRYAIGEGASGAADCVNLEACVLVVRKGECASGVEEASGRLQAAGCRLEVYPNPFTAGVRVQWSGVSEKQKISLRIYDLSGRLVKTLITNPLSLITAVEWDGRDNRDRLLPAGIYFLELCVGEYNAIHKLVLVK